MTARAKQVRLSVRNACEFLCETGRAYVLRTQAGECANGARCFAQRAAALLACAPDRRG